MSIIPLEDYEVQIFNKNIQEIIERSQSLVIDPADEQEISSHAAVAQEHLRSLLNHEWQSLKDYRLAKTLMKALIQKFDDLVSHTEQKCSKIENIKHSIEDYLLFYDLRNNDYQALVRDIQAIRSTFNDDQSIALSYVMMKLEHTFEEIAYLVDDLNDVSSGIDSGPYARGLIEEIMQNIETELEESRILMADALRITNLKL